MDKDVVYTYTCSNMDGPRECHTEWSQTEKENYHKKDTNELTYKTERDSLTDLENELMVFRGIR